MCPILKLNTTKITEFPLSYSVGSVTLLLVLDGLSECPTVCEYCPLGGDGEAKNVTSKVNNRILALFTFFLYTAYDTMLKKIKGALKAHNVTPSL